MNARRTAFLRRLAGAVCPPKLQGTRDGALWADAAMGPLKAAWARLSAKERGRAGVRWARSALTAAFYRKPSTRASVVNRLDLEARRKARNRRKAAARRKRR